MIPGSPLAEILKARIKAQGPLSVAEYMGECLLHPRYGYYSTRDPLGAAGDFTTAPEISQMFGELLGLALAQSWLDRGAPSPFALVEPGPGRGSLMADILRATRAVPGFHAAAQVHLIEASPPLRARQKQALAGWEGAAITWHDNFETLPDLPLFLIANEFFDALPIRQFQRVDNGWRERVIGLREGALAFGLGAPVNPAHLAPRLVDTRPGAVVETCAPAQAIMARIGARIATRGGVALVIDYGGWHSLGDTLQALRDHAPVPVLATPGQADLTAHVDFEALAQAAPENVIASRMTPQGVLLERLGIAERARVLARALGGAALDNHIAAHRRLTHPSEMGTLFQALAFARDSTPVVPGFGA